MKSEDVKIYESGNHCFGDILRVNSVDYEDISKEDIKEPLKEKKRIIFSNRKDR